MYVKLKKQTYPVLHFSMAGGKHMEKEQLERYLLYILEDNERHFGIECDSLDTNVRLLHLISTLYEQTGKQVVVLIDEYDAPLLDVVHEVTSLDILRNVMRKYEFTPIDLGERMDAGKEDFDAATKTMTTIMPLLYQSGYITIKGYDWESKLYELALPNQEVRVGMYRSLLPHYLNRNTTKGNTTIAKMSVLIRRGYMEGALQLMSDFLETIPYCDNTHYEGHYQQMLYIMFALLTDYWIIVEQHTSRGRIDITLETQSTIYVMELKFGKTAQEALSQINDKHYADAFKLSAKKIVKVGMNFCVKEEVNTLEWVIE